MTTGNGYSPQPVAPSAPNANALLQVRNLKMHFAITKGVFGGVKGYVKAVDDVTFDINVGETLGLVGESGCGKTTVGRCIVRAYKPTGGQMLYYGRGDGQVVDLATLDENQLKPYRRDIRMIFQDPYSSLNPRMPVFENVSEALVNLTNIRGSEMEDRVKEAIVRVGLRPEYIRRFPHAFSGGERQRIVIARALVTNPKLVICDEAVAALDVSIRAQVLNLLEQLRQELSLTYLFVSHDLSVVRYICDRVAVMYVGRIVEVAPVNDLFRQPKHPYTEALMSSVPIQNPRHRNREARIRLEGEVADPSNPPSGCYFHPRCRYAQERCRLETPPLRDIGPGRQVACHFAEELELRGAVMGD
ncbi:MAG: ATP-binding cassette domain-containing protein, partial [Thermoflexales bacterium]|nr:ATP-binding cassette domain-containing protein [Thermoflexales bacterium]